MNIEKIKNFKLPNDVIVKYTNFNNISKVFYMPRKNNACPIKKLNKFEYMDCKTGEIKKCDFINNRGDNINSISCSVAKLRDLINFNFCGSSCELWATLTFGKDKVYNSFELYNIFEKFIKRLRYKYNKQSIDYIYVPEPHDKKDWHIHVLFRSDKTLYIDNKTLSSIWGHGFVKVNRLKDVDNIGAYLSAYLTNVKDGEKTVKGAKLYLYPPNHKLYRCSSGIKSPISFYMSYKDAKEKINTGVLTYSNTIKITTNVGFVNTLHYEYYINKNISSQERNDNEKY